MLVLSGSVVAVSVVSPVALAQSQVPDAPTAVAVYSIESQMLEVRWSSSDSSTTSFKVQWKSASEEFDSSRQLSSDPATSIVSEQSTSAGDRYKKRITGLTDGTEYTVRVIAANSNGDSDPSGEVTGTPQSAFGQPRLFVENEVVEILESSHPWLRETWDYITTQDVPVRFRDGSGGFIQLDCPPVRPLVSNLRKCYARAVSVGKSSSRLIRLITHELAHVYSLASSVTSSPGPLGVAYLYFDALISPRGLGGSFCIPTELYADALTILTLGDRARDRGYWKNCPVTNDNDTVTEQALAVVRSASRGDMPSWFADAYNDSNGDRDLERVWAQVKALPVRGRAIVAFHLRDAFGGYCDDQKATASVFSTGTTRNPWSDGGCVPEAPQSVAATATGSGRLTVSWREPTDDGGSPVTGYKIQWKSGPPGSGSSRRAVVTNLSNLRRTINGLTNDESHTIRVLAYNHNGDGAAGEVTATPTAADTTVPTLLTARFIDGFVRLTWDETLNASSEPATTAFTVNVDGSSRGISYVSMSGNVVALSLTGAVSASDSLTVGYTAPAGSTANPLKDSAGNNAADFAAQMVRNDVTRVAFTSDPGPDMTYAWRNGSGGQDAIEATVTFSESVMVSGVPELELLVGGQTRRATYRSGSGTTSLVFRYEVTEGESDSVGISVPSGAVSTSTGLVRYDSDKTVAPAPVMLGPQVGHLVDAVRPALVSAHALANGNDVTVTMDEALDEDSMLALNGNGFDIQKNGARVSRISAISVVGKVVTLTLRSTILETDHLWVFYERLFSKAGSSTEPLTDVFGNLARPISSRVSIWIPNSSPEFPTGEDGVRIVDENTPANRNIGSAIAADDDADDDSLTYSISGADAALFDVIATSGQLRTKAALDHESRDSYFFTMSVHDSKDINGNSDTTVDDTISVTVIVDDVDEPADVSFSASGGVTADSNALAVDENHDGTLAAFSASDPENKAGLTYTWSLGGSDRGDFAITSAGVLSFVNIPDFERPVDSGGNSVYDIAVSARDSDNKTGTIAVTVTVHDFNEAPTITGDETPSFPENSVRSVATYRATDPERDAVFWLVSGTDGEVFDISDAGVLAFVDVPDFEDPADADQDNDYVIRVEARDDGFNTAALDVTVTVTNSSGIEEPTITTTGGPSPYRENGTGTVYVFRARDPQGGPLSWMVTGTDSDVFAISSSGVLSFVSAPDYENPADSDRDNIYEIGVVVTDDQGLTDSADVTVMVTNDAEGVEPAISTRRPPSTYRENGTSAVYTFRATDPQRGPIAWSLEGDDRGSFILTGDSSGRAVLAFSGPPDFENPTDSDRRNDYQLTVIATDDDSHSDRLSFTVTVTNVNEGPEISGRQSLSFAEDQATDRVLATYSATDPEDPGAAITRWRTSGTDGGDFVIDEQGELRFRYTPDYERPADSGRDNEYNFSVGASDGRYYGYLEVTVTVTDVNEPPAVTGTATFTYRENGTAAGAHLQGHRPRETRDHLVGVGSRRRRLRHQRGGRAQLRQPPEPRASRRLGLRQRL